MGLDNTAEAVDHVKVESIELPYHACLVQHFIINSCDAVRFWLNASTWS